MLARLQQGIVAGLLVGMLVWLWLARNQSGVVLAAGLVLIGLGHGVVLALEFVLVHWANRRDPAPRASLAMLVRAWASETRAASLVFLWRQPFRSNAWPDRLDADGSGRRGIVFIHGFVCNRGLWNPWMAQLHRQACVFSAVNLEPVFGSIDRYVPIIDAAVSRVTDATGLPPLLVCHSMGGLAARAWLRACGTDARVCRVITIGTPHQGTWLGRFSHLPNGRQMRLQSGWLRQLEQDEPPQRAALFTCYYSNCDNIVFPTSSACLAGADNRLVPGVPHVALAFDAQVMRASLAMLASPSV